MKRKAQAGKLSWKTVQDELADRHGLAIVVVEGEESAVISKSNNNSICEHLFPSREFSPHCAEYCGMAFQNATEAGETIHVKCHADLNFLAVPFQAKEKQLVAIIGRSFTKTGDYRKATMRAASGDWQQFPAEEFFSNVHISSSVSDLEPLARRFEKLKSEEIEALLNCEKASAKLPEEIESGIENFSEESAETSKISVGESKEALAEISGETESEESAVSPEVIEKNADEISELAAWRSLFGSLHNLTYKQACTAILKFLGKRYRLKDLAWLERRENLLEIILASGSFRNQQMQFSISADDRRLIEAAQNETSLEFQERQTDETGEPQRIQLFPLAIGGEIRGAVICGDGFSDENIKRHIARFARSLAAELEILRLREQIEKQSSIADAVQKFNQSFKETDTEDFCEFLARVSTEIMRGERGSLLAFDEDTQEFSVKAAVGSRADIIKDEKENLGVKVAREVLERGIPLIVKDVQIAGMQTSPEDRKYKTRSFISYPIIINKRKIGVFNVTDKVGGGVYDERDLNVLDAFAPQLAIALDRAKLREKAGKLEVLSVTDPLTGLLNRRYLEERLAEEIKRSQRYGFPMSFMMIDVDEFKSYNDTFSHPEGDKALQLVGQALKATLRGADVAARYGGEEFSILLPQTTLSEAYLIAERIRERVEATRFPRRQVTISIGIAACSPELSTPEALILAADRAVYAAKGAGRNNVKIYKSVEMRESAPADSENQRDRDEKGIGNPAQ
jgi:diguanylate cyclase (GGDEF)-like protein